MAAKAAKNDLFIKDFIPKVSRTFALTISFLPRGLRDSVYTSYLLCRVADTLEDSPYLDSDEKYKRLTYLQELLEKAYQGEPVSETEIESLNDSIDPDRGIRTQERPKVGDGVSLKSLCAPISRILDRDLISLGTENLERSSSQKGVSSDLFPSFDAL